MQAKKEERDEETGFFQLGQVGASNLGGPQLPSENNLHAAATPSSSSSSQRVRGCPRFGIKKEIEGISMPTVAATHSLASLSRDKSGAKPRRRNMRENAMNATRDARKAVRGRPEGRRQTLRRLLTFYSLFFFTLFTTPTCLFTSEKNR